MENKDRLITPQTKVGELLKTYPQLEDMLIEIAPAFKKLRNPILRKTVAKVTSLAQAARVGSVSVTELIQRLRREVNQPDYVEDKQKEYSISSSPPSWFDENLITNTLDARPMIDAGEQPIGIVLRELDKLADGQIYELITPFEPAPLIDKAKERGLGVWVKTKNSAEFCTYFYKR